MITTQDEAHSLYIRTFGFIADSGYSLTVKKSKTSGNWVCKLWYQRNSWVDDQLEHEAVFNSEGKLLSNSGNKTVLV